MLCESAAALPLQRKLHYERCWFFFVAVVKRRYRAVGCLPPSNQVCNEEVWQAGRQAARTEATKQETKLVATSWPVASLVVARSIQKKRRSPSEMSRLGRTSQNVVLLFKPNRMNTVYCTDAFSVVPRCSTVQYYMYIVRHCTEVTLLSRAAKAVLRRRPRECSMKSII